jgi:hypothetical protein
MAAMIETPESRDRMFALDFNRTSRVYHPR